MTKCVDSSEGRRGPREFGGNPVVRAEISKVQALLVHLFVPPRLNPLTSTTRWLTLLLLLLFLLLKLQEVIP